MDIRFRTTADRRNDGCLIPTDWQPMENPRAKNRNQARVRHPGESYPVRTKPDSPRRFCPLDPAERLRFCAQRAHCGRHLAHQCPQMRTDRPVLCYRTTVLGEFWPVLASFGAFSISFSPFGVGFERHFEARSASRAHGRGCAAGEHDDGDGAHSACDAGRPLADFAGLSGRGGASYIDMIICRDKDANTDWDAQADGTLEERVYYFHNCCGDVTALLTDDG